MSLDGVREGDRLAIVDRWTGGETVTSLRVTKLLATQVLCSDGNRYRRNSGAMVGGGPRGPVAVPWTEEHDRLREAEAVRQRVWTLSNAIARKKLTRSQVERIEAILAESESVA